MSINGSYSWRPVQPVSRAHRVMIRIYPVNGLDQIPCHSTGLFYTTSILPVPGYYPSQPTEFPSSSWQKNQKLGILPLHTLERDRPLVLVHDNVIADR